MPGFTKEQRTLFQNLFLNYITRTYGTAPTAEQWAELAAMLVGRQSQTGMGRKTRPLAAD